jgi:hypothetical protein
MEKQAKSIREGEEETVWGIATTTSYSFDIATNIKGGTIHM